MLQRWDYRGDVDYLAGFNECSLDVCHINGVLYATALGLLEMLAVCLCSMYICRGFVGFFKRTTTTACHKVLLDW